MGTNRRFNGTRVKTMREARMMTAKKLSLEAGVSTTTISRVEHGGDMSLDIAERLANALGASVAAFGGVDEVLDTPVYFRSFSSATKAARKAQDARSLMANSIIDVIDDYLYFPQFDLSDICAETDINSITNDVIESAAAKVRELWHLGDGPINSLAAVAEANGVVLALTPFSVGTLDGFSRMGDLGRPIIMVNTDNGTAYRWRFDLGHEIGHMVLHQHLSDATVSDPNVNRVLESQAHYFSGALLMPEDSFIQSLPGLSINDFLSVKSYWGVSLQAMLIRARNIGILDESQYTARQVTVSKKKWRRREPLDDQRMPETPTLLRTCVSMCVEQCGLSVQQIMDDAGVPTDIFEDLIGVRRGFIKDGGFEPRVQNVSMKVIDFHGPTA
ncbi:MAG: XRE family transcriptional regulator [Coriobacteriaceae bacterium]|nr:XRE family transcriptional regulator [Coriobacteriaceae bacterium]